MVKGNAIPSSEGGDKKSVVDTPKYPIYDNGKLHISISQGNSKMGNIPQFNILPGDEPLTGKNGLPLTNIKGTCGEFCKDCKATCYAIKCAFRYHNTIIPAWGTNTVILRYDPDKVKNEITEFCNKSIVKYFRFHTSGELESLEHLDLYCDICRMNPEVTFYIYTKRFDLLVEWFVERGEKKPDNFVINLSEWHGNIQRFLSEHSKQEYADFIDSLNIFAFDDKTEASGYASKLVHCPATDKTGHETGITCAQCRRCMKSGHKTAVYAH